MPKLPVTAKNNTEIVDRIENKLGPVGKGHHNSHRTAHIVEWLQKQEKGGKKKTPSKTELTRNEISRRAAGGKS